MLITASLININSIQLANSRWPIAFSTARQPDDFQKGYYNYLLFPGRIPQQYKIKHTR